MISAVQSIPEKAPVCQAIQDDMAASGQEGIQGHQHLHDPGVQLLRSGHSGDWISLPVGQRNRKTKLVKYKYRLCIYAHHTCMGV